MRFSLWHLLMGVCFSTSIATALLAANISKAGFAGHALAVLIGVSWGTGCAYAMHRAGHVVYFYAKGRPEPIQKRFFGALYLAAVFWIFVAAFLGYWVSRTAVQPLSHNAASGR